MEKLIMSHILKSMQEIANDITIFINHSHLIHVWSMKMTKDKFPNMSFKKYMKLKVGMSIIYKMARRLNPDHLKKMMLFAVYIIKYHWHECKKDSELEEKDQLKWLVRLTNEDIVQRLKLMEKQFPTYASIEEGLSIISEMYDIITDKNE